MPAGKKSVSAPTRPTGWYRWARRGSGMRRVVSACLLLSALRVATAMAGPPTVNPEELPPYNTFAPFWILGEGYSSFVMVNNTVADDMSIGDGGLFDIGGNWANPHKSHRDGRHVDIVFKVYRNGVEVAVDQNDQSWTALESALLLSHDGAARDFDSCNPEYTLNHWHCQQGDP